ncbi:MAG: carbon-nitrogen hydrolase family protein [Prolixibacteraceae bacterium]|jgi:deaminated glutathione amidase|nr:carbon-nitrogen hydrolase family protein [Prolixibacteraceae bacterium]MBT6766505.1 carbon-nitrogen hydrolase family protein [Prolixibacteraceae bacterium]MBT6997142.1 carbon-nitrogen hydrolase family protein [Prolixibacteraceae bacterium]MBT7393325.1 carbon-nitrogen hydrolase family protein [Prolixibacteraceae bacterium]
MENKLKVATVQFAVNSDVGKNLSAIRKQIKKAADQKADVVHFSECCLSGYGGIDFEEFKPEKEKQIKEGISEICNLAKQHKIWVIFGTHFFEGEMEKPFNSLFVINNFGEIEHRYDKRLPAEFDLDWYTSGTEPGIFKLNGIKCGLLICHEWRYPELYRQCYHLGVELLFQSWYDGNYSEEEYQEEGKNLGEVIPGFVRGNAANNKLWISGANTSKKQSSFSAFIAQPDGRVLGKLKRNVAGVLISMFDFDKKHIDLSSHLRDKVSQMKY